MTPRRTKNLIPLTRLGAVALGLAALAGPALAQNVPAAAATSASSTALRYTIGPSDVLQINVWKEAELSREATVRFDGMITVPLLGDVPAAGRTPGQLAESLTNGLKQYIEAPRVTIGVNQANSFRFFVVGQVTRSGEFPLSGRTTVLQGLSVAGGFREFAKTEAIVIVRLDQTVIPFNFKRVADGRDVSQNVLLSPGDTIVVP